jgi:uncharacterized protein YuzB (UPF0349 family)
MKKKDEFSPQVKFCIRIFEPGQEDSFKIFKETDDVVENKCKSECDTANHRIWGSEKKFEKLLA